MEQILKDKDQFPTDEIIFSHIGKTKKYWEGVFQFIHEKHPDLSEQWRYYNDGKSWLMKVSHKTKTIFWLSVIKNSFSTTFYFTDKVEELILNSKLSDELKNNFISGKRYNKIRGITINFKNKKDVEYFKTIIEIKLKMK